MIVQCSHSNFDSQSAAGGETMKQHTNTASNSTGSIGKYAIYVKAMAMAYLKNNNQLVSIK